MNRKESVNSFIEENKRKPKRIATLDFQRGLAIWMMVILHSIQEIYDVSWAVNLNELFQKPIPVIISVALLGLLSGWAGYFLLISAIVNSYSMTKKVKKGLSAERRLLKQILTGIGILLVAILTESVIGYHGYLGHALSGNIPWKVTDIWSSPLAKGFYTMETLQTIGWCMIINGFIHYFLLRKNGHEKFKRNMTIYLILIISIITASYFMWNWVDNMGWEALFLDGKTLVWPNEKVQAANHSFKAYVFTVLTGDLEPLFPFLATSLTGSMIGLSLAKPVNKFPRWGGLATLVFFILGGGLIAIGEVTKDSLIMFDLGWERPTLSYFMILMGLWVGLVSLLLWLVEYKGRSKSFAENGIVKYFRLWGMIALSIYVLQIFMLFPRWLFSFLVDDNLLNEKLPYEEAGYALLVAVLILFFFDRAIKFWSKIDFKFSFEWMIIRLASLKQGEISSRLNVQLMMNEVKWITFSEELKENDNENQNKKTI